MHFSWQAQYFGEDGVSLFVAAAFREILRDSRSAKWVSKMGCVRSPKRRVRDDDFMFGSCSDHARNILESSLYWWKQFRDFSLKS